MAMAAWVLEGFESEVDEGTAAEGSSEEADEGSIAAEGSGEEADDGSDSEVVGFDEEAYARGMAYGLAPGVLCSIYAGALVRDAEMRYAAAEGFESEFGEMAAESQAAD